MTGAEQRFKHELDVNRLALARDALMVHDQARVLDNDHAVVNSHHLTNLKNYKPPEEPVIQIGDQNITNQAPQPPKRGMHPLLAMAIGAGLLASGAGAGVGAWMIADAIKNVKLSPRTEGDGNTKYQLKLLP